MKRIAIAVFVAVSLQSVAWSFNSAGHGVIGLLAYEQMEPVMRKAVADLLRKHPRFDDHFAKRMPDAVSKGTREDQDRWLFAAAGSWADYVRGCPNKADRERFNHGKWHYVNFPIFLTDRDETAMKDTLSINLDYNPPKKDLDGMNIMQAMSHAQILTRAIMEDRGERAVALCWVFHLVADAHQPCHSSALFTAGRFKDGDRGANSIKCTPGGNLHSVWDKAILGSGSITKLSDYNRMKRKAAEFMEFEVTPDMHHSVFDNKPSLVPLWILTSRDVAEKEVYTPYIRDYVKQRETLGDFGKVKIPTEYFKHAADVVKVRAIIAGERLAHTLSESFKWKRKTKKHVRKVDN